MRGIFFKNTVSWRSQFYGDEEPSIADSDDKKLLKPLKEGRYK